MHILLDYLIVFLGAGIGGALRHTVNVAAFRLLGSGFPSTRSPSILSVRSSWACWRDGLPTRPILARRGGYSSPPAFWVDSRPFPRSRSTWRCPPSVGRAQLPIRGGFGRGVSNSPVCRSVCRPAPRLTRLMNQFCSRRKLWALLSAAFAALTAIFAGRSRSRTSIPTSPPSSAPS
jgi:hypothetical protein